MATKYVYFFGNGDAEGDESMRPILGGKGANLIFLFPYSINYFCENSIIL